MKDINVYGIWYYVDFIFGVSVKFKIRLWSLVKCRIYVLENNLNFLSFEKIKVYYNTLNILHISSLIIPYLKHHNTGLPFFLSILPDIYRT